MVRLLYKPIGMVLGILAGIVAGRMVTRAWLAFGEGDEPPAPDERDTTWRLVLIGAAIQGAVPAVVKAAMKRGGAHGVQLATGVWPGKSSTAAAD